jgi:hypothetical protein
MSMQSLSVPIPLPPDVRRAQALARGFSPLCLRMDRQLRGDVPYGVRGRAERERPFRRRGSIGPVRKTLPSYDDIAITRRHRADRRRGRPWPARRAAARKKRGQASCRAG